MIKKKKLREGGTGRRPGGGRRGHPNREISTAKVGVFTTKKGGGFEFVLKKRGGQISPTTTGREEGEGVARNKPKHVKKFPFETTEKTGVKGPRGKKRREHQASGQEKKNREEGKE